MQTSRPHCRMERPVMPTKLAWARSGSFSEASPPPWCGAGAGVEAAGAVDDCASAAGGSPSAITLPTSSIQTSGTSARWDRCRIASIVRISSSRASFDGWVRTARTAASPTRPYTAGPPRPSTRGPPRGARLLANQSLDLLAMRAEAVEHAVADHHGGYREPARAGEEVQARIRILPHVAQLHRDAPRLQEREGGLAVGVAFHREEQRFDHGVSTISLRP